MFLTEEFLNEYDYDSYRDYHQKDALPLPFIYMGSLLFIAVGAISLCYDVLIKEPVIALAYIAVGIAHLLFPKKSKTWFKHRDIVKLKEGRLTWRFYRNSEDIDISTIASVSKTVGTLEIQMRDGRTISFPLYKIYDRSKYEEFNKQIVPALLAAKKV